MPRRATWASSSVSQEIEGARRTREQVSNVVSVRRSRLSGG